MQVHQQCPLAANCLLVLHTPNAGTKLTTSTDAELSQAERALLIDSLQRAANGQWSIKYVCARATDCGCPYAITFKHEGNGSVVVAQQEAHQLHTPGSIDDLAKLKMHPDLQGLGLTLLRLGVKPDRVRCELNDTALKLNLLDTSGGSMQQASNARGCITLAQVHALGKQLRRQQGYGLTSDASAVSLQMEQYERRGVVAFYQPYRARTQDSGQQPLIIILQTPFQARMLFQFGAILVFMDSTFGTNKYGYPAYALVVSQKTCSQQWACKCWAAAGSRRCPLDAGGASSDKPLTSAGAR